MKKSGCKLGEANVGGYCVPVKKLYKELIYMAEQQEKLLQLIEHLDVQGSLYPFRGISPKTPHQIRLSMGMKKKHYKEMLRKLEGK